MVEANAFVRSQFVIRLKVNIQRTSCSSVLKRFEEYNSRRLRPFPRYDSAYRTIFHRLEIGMNCVSDELTRCYKKCKQQSHLKCPKF